MVAETTSQYLLRQTLNNILSDNGLKKLISTELNTNPTVKEVAYIVCQIIKEDPINLPVAEGINDPYIGKLRLLGIWQKDYIDINKEMPNDIWEEIYKNVIKYKDSTSPIKYEDAKVQEKINSYYNKLKNKQSYKDVDLGEIVVSDYTLTSGDYTYPLYSLQNSNYIDADTLRAIGYTIQPGANGYMISLTNTSTVLDKSSIKEPRQVKLIDKNVYINDVKTYVISGDGRIFIPLRALESDYHIGISGKKVDIYNKQYEEKYVKYINGELTNQSLETITIETINYYWNGKELVSINLKDTLEPNEVLKPAYQLEQLRDGKYITTEVKSVKTSSNTINYTSENSKNILALLKHYQKSVQDAEIDFDEIFPGGAIMATITRSTNGLTKGEQVEVHMGDGGYYTVISDKGNKIRVSRSNLYIQQHTKVTAKPATKDEIEKYINKQDISSNTQYLVWTDIYRQTTYVLKGSKNSWELIRRMPCSTGENTTPTPRGFYTLNAKVPSFGQSKGYCCKNAFGFIGTVYLYHSVLFDTSGSYIISGKRELGVEKASHGCIRLTPEDSKWMYNTVSQGTKAWIN